MIIVKVGGGKDINWDYIARDTAALKERVIIVHGANAAFTEISEKFGNAERMIASPSGHISRYTDLGTMNLLTMVYSGLMNKKIVACLQKYGVNAVGLTGADGKLWLGKRKKAILAKDGAKTKLITDSLTGKVESVNTRLINVLLEGGFTPVITIPAITASGELINVDNDRALAIMARDLQVKTLVILFEAPGLMERLDDSSSKISHINKGEIKKFLDNSEGRMKKKLLGVSEATNAGVTNIYFGDGRITNPISLALKGRGTTIN